jgi:CD2 antigen cytoplasmic tail-binding protein 2
MPATNGDRKGVRFAVQDGMEEGESDHQNRHHDRPQQHHPRGTHHHHHHHHHDEAPSSLPASKAGNEIRHHRSKKRSRPEYNVDEIDDVDDWRPEDEDDDEANDGNNGVGGAVLSEKALLEAKRIRRLKRAVQLENGDEYDDVDDDNEIPGRVDASGRAGIGGGARREANQWDRKVGASLLDDADADDNDGIPITPFNMDQEENDGDGYFDGDTYVFRRGGGGNKDDEEPDAWADASDDEFNEAADAIPKAGSSRSGAGAFATRPGSSTDGARRGPNFDEWTEQELYARIVPLVSDTETVTAAIVRYGSLIRHQSKRAGAASDAGPTGEAPAESSTLTSSSRRAQEALNELTEASSALLLKGQVDIYQKTRTDLLRMLSKSENGEREESAVQARRDEVTPHKTKAVQWEYMGNEDKQIHGPYASEQMRQWIAAGYFVGASAVQVRPIFAEERAGEDLGATLQDDLMNDLMDDEDHDNDDNDNAYKDGDHLKPAAKEQVRGDWQQSDQVDFRQFD